MAVQNTSKYSDKNIVLYDYKPNRKHENPENFLKGFKGYIHADGYQGYHKLGDDFVVVGCWAHCRRKFAEALEMISKDKRIDSTAGIALDYCNQL